MSVITSKTASPELPKALADINQQIKALHLPTSVYLGIHLNYQSKQFEVAELGGHGQIRYHQKSSHKSLEDALITWLKSHSKQHELKIVAALLGARHQHSSLISRLWLDLDIVPAIVSQDSHKSKEDVLESARQAEGLFNSDNSAKPILTSSNQVLPSTLVTQKDYQSSVSKGKWQLLELLADKFGGKTLTFISATPQGGGVALMRHALVRLLTTMGMDVRWHVMRDDPDVFAITKTKFHNVLQAVAPANTKLTNREKALFNSWSRENAANLQEVISSSQVIVIDDPQPAGLIPHIQRINPQAKIIYRSHIQVESALVNQPLTQQSKTWGFIWGFASQADLFVSHPVPSFVPANVPAEKVVTMPPTTDFLDGLNKPLSRGQQTYYLQLFNKHLLETNQVPLDTKRPYILQIARFDPSKGIPDVLNAYYKLCQRMGKKRPQLVIAGNGSIDDPDGLPILNLIRHTVSQAKFANLRADIKIARLPHIDQLLNTLARQAKVALQLSHKEGFEVKVSEKLMKGVPVIAYRAGGIPLQIKHQVTGFLVEVGDSGQVAEYLYQLLTNPPLYARMRQACLSADYFEVSTIANAINWLFLANQLVSRGELVGQGQSLTELIKQRL